MDKQNELDYNKGTENLMLTSLMTKIKELEDENQKLRNALMWNFLHNSSNTEVENE